MSVPDSSSAVAKLWRKVWEVARFVDSGGARCRDDGLLHRALVEMVEDRVARGGVAAGARCREEVLPGQTRRRLGQLQAQGMRQVDLAAAGDLFGAVAVGDELELRAEGVASDGRQEGRAVLVVFAAADDDLPAIQVDVLHAQGKGLHEAEAAPVQELGDQAKRRHEVLEKGSHLTTAKDGREVRGPMGPLEAVEVWHRHVEDASVKEKESAEGLVLGRGRGAAFDGKMVEKGGDLRGTQLARVAAGLGGKEGADPVDVGLLGAGGVVEATEGSVNGFDQGHARASIQARRRLCPGCEKSVTGVDGVG